MANPLEELAKLEPGWYSHGAAPIDPRVLTVAKEVLGFDILWIVNSTEYNLRIVPDVEPRQD